MRKFFVAKSVHLVHSMLRMVKAGCVTRGTGHGSGIGSAGPDATSGMRERHFFAKPLFAAAAPAGDRIAEAHERLLAEPGLQFDFPVIAPPELPGWLAALFRAL